MITGSRTRYGVVLADVPWAYQNWALPKNGAASSAMTCQDEEFLKSIPVDWWALPDAALFFWTTFPKLDKAFEIASAWGFGEFVSGFPWVKTSPNTGRIRSIMGFWTRAAAELLLIFRRGNVPTTRDRHKTPVGLMHGAERVFWAPPEKREHSSKPLGIHEWIASQIKGPYLELFARNQTPGWVCWGYDLGQELGPWGVRARAEAPKLPQPAPEALADTQITLF